MKQTKLYMKQTNLYMKQTYRQINTFGILVVRSLWKQLRRQNVFGMTRNHYIRLWIFYLE